MAESTEPARWLGRVAIVAWVVVGVATVLLAPTKEPPAPGYAELLFGAAPSMQSSARGGTLLLARLLERQGFTVQTTAAYGPPIVDSLFMLAPRIGLGEEEAGALVAWVRAGGHLVYAPVIVTLEPAAEAKDGEKKRVRLDDELLQALQADAVGESAKLGAATVWDIGRGRVAWLDDGAAPLTNERLGAVGLAPELDWLEMLLNGSTTVAFDEGRIGFAEPEGVLALLGRSRFGAGLKLGIFGLVLWLVAIARRRLPARAEPPPGTRAFGEHIDAVAALLNRGARVPLAGRLLLHGTIRRLGALARVDDAQAALRDAGQALAKAPTTLTLAREAERLRQLERRLKPNAAFTRGQRM
jgi:hypothetical protein